MDTAALILLTHLIEMHNAIKGEPILKPAADKLANLINKLITNIEVEKA